MTEALPLPHFKRSLAYLSQLYESGTTEVLKVWLEMVVPNHADDILRTGALLPDGLAWEIPCEDGEWREVRELEPGVFGWFSVQEGYVTVTEAQQRCYRVSHRWFIDALKQHLKVKGHEHVLMPECLLCLGQIEVNAQPFDILLARGIYTRAGFQAIYTALTNQSAARPSVVLTPTISNKPLLALPGDFPVVSVLDLLASESPCILEPQHLHQIIRERYLSSHRLEVVLEDYGHSAELQSEGRNKWSVVGDKRCHIVRSIYRAWVSGLKGVTTDQLQEEGIFYTHPKNCFKDLGWSEYIHYKNKLWRLKASPYIRYEQ